MRSHNVNWIKYNLLLCHLVTLSYIVYKIILVARSRISPPTQRTSWNWSFNRNNDSMTANMCFFILLVWFTGHILTPDIYLNTYITTPVLHGPCSILLYGVVEHFRASSSSFFLYIHSTLTLLTNQLPYIYNTCVVLLRLSIRLYATMRVPGMSMMCIYIYDMRTTSLSYNNGDDTNTSLISYLFTKHTHSYALVIYI